MKTRHVPHHSHDHHERAPRAIPTPEWTANDEIPDLEPDLRYRMISEAAYHRYLDRGCVDGYDVDDWLTAEADVERELRAAGRESVE